MTATMHYSWRNLRKQKFFRQKAAKPDGLDSDSLKIPSDYMPALVIVSNEIRIGAAMPPSFLEDLILPLRKRGTSQTQRTTDPSPCSKPAIKFAPKS